MKKGRTKKQEWGNECDKRAFRVQYDEITEGKKKVMEEKLLLLFN